MTPRAVICDVYHTILHIGPPPEDRDERWIQLGQRFLGHPPPLSLSEFEEATGQLIAQQHLRARAAGVDFPEIFWPAVVRSVLPAAEGWSDERLDDFLILHAGLNRTVSLMPGAASTLRELRRRGVPLGIASNAQPYTLRELHDALNQAGAGDLVFEPDLVFWSFAHGFSKPSPHVFRLLGARLQARRISPSDTLMVGDRADNDIEPARAQGWLTWQLGPGHSASGGPWSQLSASLTILHEALPNAGGSLG